MAFGQQSGRPASQSQVRELLELLQNLGHDDFRDARGPMGFNQRQAGGKFTADEAQELIDELLEAEYQADQAAESPPSEVAKPAPNVQKASRPAKRSKAAKTPKPRAKTTAAPLLKQPNTEAPSVGEKRLAPFSDEVLAAELQRRGWVVMEP